MEGVRQRHLRVRGLSIGNANREKGKREGNDVRAVVLFMRFPRRARRWQSRSGANDEVECRTGGEDVAFGRQVVWRCWISAQSAGSRVAASRAILTSIARNAGLRRAATCYPTRATQSSLCSGPPNEEKAGAAAPSSERACDAAAWRNLPEDGTLTGGGIEWRPACNPVRRISAVRTRRVAASVHGSTPTPGCRCSRSMQVASDVGDPAWQSTREPRTMLLTGAAPHATEAGGSDARGRPRSFRGCRR